jgi:hypothetical protein
MILNLMNGSSGIIPSANGRRLTRWASTPGGFAKTQLSVLRRLCCMRFKGFADVCLPDWMTNKSKIALCRRPGQISGIRLHLVSRFTRPGEFAYGG